MFVGINLGINQLRSSTSMPFTPASLFALGEPGVWFDPSDLTTLFQDTAGTTPVTTPGQTVALMLDKSKGLTLGTELVTNGTFPVNTTGWSVDSGAVLSVDTERLKVVTTQASGALQVLSGFVVGKTYKISIEVTVGGSDWNLILGRGFGQAQGFQSGRISASQTYSRVYTHTDSATNVLSLYSYGAGTTFYDNISVRELPGFHATQATAASRPTYGVVPLGGRRNLLTYSEQFDNGAWSKSFVTVTANATTAPDGSMTADKLIQTANNTSHSITQTIVAPAGATRTAYAKAGGYNFFAMTYNNSATNSVTLNLTTGAITNIGANVTSQSATNVGDGWWRLSMTVNAAVTNVTDYVLQAPGFSAETGNGTDGIFIWGAQLETGSTATAYQRVTTQYDVTEAGVQSLSYLSFDGVDDFMLTGTITPGVDKAQIFAGVRKLSDAARAILVESGATGTDVGSFGLNAPRDTSRTYLFTAGGTVLTSSQTTSTSFAAPVSNVVSGLADIAADGNTLRVNGTVAGTVATDQGTGNFANLPIYIGRRGGTTFPFSGSIYSMIIRFGANLDTAAIQSTEAWVASKSGFPNWANIVSPTIFARDNTAVLDRANSIIERRA